MPVFETPLVVESADEALELARSFVDDDAQVQLANTENPVTCSAGCSQCCNQAVPVSAAEVRAIRSFIDAQDMGRRTELEGRISKTVDALQNVNLGGPVPAVGHDERTGFVDRYFKAAIRCPMLDADGTCGVRPVRPLACREYLVASDPVHCQSLGSTQIVRLQSKRDPIAGFRKVSSAFDEPEVGVLALELARTSQSAPAAKQLSGAGVVQLLVSTRRSR